MAPGGSPARNPSKQPSPPAQQHGQTPPAVSPTNDEDATSDFEENFASDTTSLKSEIYAYRFENGRRYHAYKDGAYWGPNDEKQNEQLDIAHHMFSLMLDGRLLLAPIDENLQRALDIGTGTGIWAIDFADQYPSAEVIGNDLSPIQPAFVPPNLRFEIDDVCEEWTYPEDHFDLIHVRALYGAIPDWPLFYSRALKHLKPGGWFEQLEMSIQWRSDEVTLADDHVFSVWSKICTDAGEKAGRTFRTAELSRQYMEEAGFEGVVETKYKVPLGNWSSDPHMRTVGRWNLLHCEEGIEGWAMALLTRQLKWAYEEVQVLLAQMRAALRDPKLHAYYNVVIVYGRKPLQQANQ